MQHQVEVIIFGTGLAPFSPKTVFIFLKYQHQSTVGLQTHFGFLGALYVFWTIGPG